MADPITPSSTGPSERTIVFLVGAVQFVNILDFMMVMPLGPDLAIGLGIPTDHLGVIGGSYTAAASLSGLVASLFLDRFDRRRALAVAMLGLVVGTFAGGFATGLGTLIAARVLAGIFGGPAASLAMAIIADVIPAERRGRAMGAVMGAFSVASVLGVPAGLELARRGGWRMPFFAVAAVGLLITVLALIALPPLRLHLARDRAGHDAGFFEVLARPVVLLSLALTTTLMMSSFVLVPNISAYLQHNLGYPRARLGLLYLAGGSVGFFGMRVIGRMVDRFGSFRVGTVGTFCLLPVLYFAFAAYDPAVPIVVLFVLYMVTTSMRGVPYNALSTKVPAPRERARFLSIQSAVQHAASAAGAFLSSQLLHELPDHRLEGMPKITLIAMLLVATFPPLAWMVESRVRRMPAE